MSEMLEFPWERDAMRGAEMPDGLSLHDQMAYLSLRTIYHDYREKRIDRAKASAEKRKIAAARDRAEQIEVFQSKQTAFRAKVLKNTEMAVTAVRKDPNPENAIRLCDVLDGIERSVPTDADREV